MEGEASRQMAEKRTATPPPGFAHRLKKEGSPPPGTKGENGGCSASATGQKQLSKQSCSTPPPPQEAAQSASLLLRAQGMAKYEQRQ